jgi:hypothetical protein
MSSVVERCVVSNLVVWLAIKVPRQFKTPGHLVAIETVIGLEIVTETVETGAIETRGVNEVVNAAIDLAAEVRKGAMMIIIVVIIEDELKNDQDDGSIIAFVTVEDE